jgi:hypothetical protein
VTRCTVTLAWLALLAACGTPGTSSAPSNFPAPPLPAETIAPEGTVAPTPTMARPSPTAVFMWPDGPLVWWTCTPTMHQEVRIYLVVEDESGIVADCAADLIRVTLDAGEGWTFQPGTGDVPVGGDSPLNYPCLLTSASPTYRAIVVSDTTTDHEVGARMCRELSAAP